MPVIGPRSYEEAIARIEDGIREMEQNEGYSWEDVKSEILLAEEV